MQAEGEVVPFPEAVHEAPRDFRAFFEDEHLGLLKLLHFVTGDRSEAADLMQDAFLKLWERWDRIEHDRGPAGVPVPGRAERLEMRARAARRAAKHALPLGVANDPFDDVDIREDVRRMLLTVTPRQRAALVLLDLYGYGSEDAAGSWASVRPPSARSRRRAAPYSDPRRPPW